MVDPSPILLMARVGLSLMSESNLLQFPVDSKQFSQNEKKKIFTVGIGASAGGLKAIESFFRAMPSDSGMAFVVIVQIPPDHESNLSSIIQNYTRMKVTHVTTTLTIKANNIYVIPPNHHLELVGEDIRLVNAPKVYGKRIPIDVLFRTIAKEYRNHGIGVVLSGTGSDGSLGLKRQ